MGAIFGSIAEGIKKFAGEIVGKQMKSDAGMYLYGQSMYAQYAVTYTTLKPETPITE